MTGVNASGNDTANGEVVSMNGSYDGDETSAVGEAVAGITMADGEDTSAIASPPKRSKVSVTGASFDLLAAEEANKRGEYC